MASSHPFSFIAVTTAFLLAPAASLLAAEGPPGPRVERVQFAKGASSSTIKGKITGEGDVDYRVRAGAGQTITVSLKGSNRQNYFNVLPPGSDTAMVVERGAEPWKAMLPDDGEYTIRVYLMRAAARRKESSQYTLTVGVAGKALAPVPASKDALVPGTHFHAKATITCAPMFDPKPQPCEAFVTRRDLEGSASIEVRPANGIKRRILFVKGEASASDSPDAMSSSRKGDVCEVKFGTDESYAVPDALVRGG